MSPQDEAEEQTRGSADALPALDPRVTALGTPGRLREALVAAVLTGAKTATTCLRVLYELAGQQPPRPGTRSALVDSRGDIVAAITYTGVDEMALGAVGWDVAVAEGEGFASVAEWRAQHEAFWAQFVPAIRARLDAPDWTMTDDTPVVVCWFRVSSPQEA